MSQDNLEKISFPDAWWSVPADQATRTLGTPATGLSDEQVQQRLTQYGPNVLREKNRETALGLFLSQLKSPIMLILLIATIISAFLQDFTDAIIILIIVLGSALLSFVQEYRASNAAEQRSCVSDLECALLETVRAGRWARCLAGPAPGYEGR
jgi:magnesium-transporting ATPase (P-type)